jgi:hypothetical protein
MGCCCTSVGLSRFIAVFGILISVAVICGPAYIFFSGRDFSELFLFLKEIHKILEDEYEKKELTEKTLIQIRELLNSVSEQAWLGALVAVCLAGLNIFLDLLLLIGASCRIRCMFLPWLVFSILEILFLGVPIAIFFSLLGTYLYVEGLLVASIISFAAPCTIVLGYLLVWLIVLVGYWNAHKLSFNQMDDTGELEVQPLINDSQGGSAGTSYNLGQYPQYYPPHAHSAAGGPSAPPQTTPTEKNNPNLYPTLPA